jgi:Copper amine oxidase, enzyme domain
MRLVVVALITLGLSSPAAAQSGHTNWNGWSFDFEVKDGAGLALRNVSYNGELVLWKASMPVIRVHYETVGDHTCGPYADRIDTYNLVPIAWCGNNKVCQESYTAGGHQMLEIGVEAKIGQYDLYQVWYLSQDGWIGAHLFSKGLQCAYDHDHHPYWRMDFDVNGFANDQLFVFDNNRPDQGWGQGWLKYTNELNDVKNGGTARAWFVRDNPTTHGVWLLPGSSDGAVDGFSTKDFGGRRYHANEDQPWPFGAPGHLGYADNENIEQQDVVAWYVAHLHHVASQGAGIWHSAGPWMKVQR